MGELGANVFSAPKFDLGIPDCKNGLDRFFLKTENKNHNPTPKLLAAICTTTMLAAHWLDPANGRPGSAAQPHEVVGLDVAMTDQA